MKDFKEKITAIENKLNKDYVFIERELIDDTDLTNEQFFAEVLFRMIPDKTSHTLIDVPLFMDMFGYSEKVNNGKKFKYDKHFRRKREKFFKHYLNLWAEKNPHRVSQKQYDESKMQLTGYYADLSDYGVIKVDKYMTGDYPNEFFDYDFLKKKIDLDKANIVMFPYGELKTIIVDDEVITKQSRRELLLRYFSLLISSINTKITIYTNDFVGGAIQNFVGTMGTTHKNFLRVCHITSATTTTSLSRILEELDLLYVGREGREYARMSKRGKYEIRLSNYYCRPDYSKYLDIWVSEMIDKGFSEGRYKYVGLPKVKPKKTLPASTNKDHELKSRSITLQN